MKKILEAFALQKLLTFLSENGCVFAYDMVERLISGYKILNNWVYKIILLSKVHSQNFGHLAGVPVPG